jgi:LysR family hydrogen peroxide-inducible transcriptional activator
MITLTQLGYLVAVERFGNFHQAAKSCFVTQPTLSMQIKKLEDDLGILIFDRSSQPIAPTPIGQLIIDQSRLVLSQASKIEQIVSLTKDELSGELRLAVIPTMSPYLVPLFLNDLQKQCPNVQLSIEEARTVDIIEGLNRNKYDVGLLATPLGEESLVEHFIFNEAFYVYAAKDSDLASMAEVDDQSLKDDHLLLLTEGHCLREQTLRVCRGRRSRASTTGGLSFSSGSLETLCRLVERDQGYTVIPELAASWEARRQGVVIPFKEPVPTREVSLVVHRSFMRTKLLTKLVEVIAASLPASIAKDARRQRTVPIG